jgi:predicted MFS family arabinose efflux permease
MNHAPLAATRPARTGLPAAVLAVAAATFCVVTSEMLPVGLLTPVASGLGVSDGTAGLAVTVPGLVAAVAAPLMLTVVRRADRRSVLLTLMVLLAAANGLSALAPVFPVLLAARVLVGVCIGGVWAIAAGLAVRLVPAVSVGRATGLIFSGIAVASVVGVPAGTLMGELTGWRAAFAASGGLALAVAAALALTLPPLPAGEPVRLRALTGVWRVPAARTGLLMVLLLVSGHFAAYTYIRPVLERADGIGAGTIGALLLVYGVAGIAGNFFGATAAARDPRRTLLTISAVLAAAVLLLVPAGGSAAASAALIVVWGLAYGGVSVSMQNWMMAAAPDAREAGSALFAGVFNAAIGLGALMGGRAAELSGGPGNTLWLGAALAVSALVMMATLRSAPGPRTRPAKS